MSDSVDNLLDAALTSEEGTTDNKITLTIDEPTRTINYDGNLILGVKGDRFAERIYFNCPQFVHKDDSVTIDLSLDTTKIYINYKNAYNEPYIEECSKGGVQEDGSYLFSWFVSDIAAIQNGKVTFNVCVKDESGNFTDASGDVIINEWHTTTFDGTILPSVDVSEKTPEVITSDTVTSQAIIDAYNELTEQLSDVNEYIDTQVEEKAFPNITIDAHALDYTDPMYKLLLKYKNGEIHAAKLYLIDGKYIAQVEAFGNNNTRVKMYDTALDRGVVSNYINKSTDFTQSDITVTYKNVQTKLTAGDNITIDANNVISSSNIKFKFIKVETYTDLTGGHLIDLTETINSYNEVMIVYRSEITSSSDSSASTLLIQENASPFTTYLTMDNLTGTKYVKVLITKTGEDDAGSTYLDISSVDSVNGSQFSWVACTSDGTFRVATQMTGTALITSANRTIKIYAR